MKALLPLFPLDVVLFPGTPLPLHVFEPRYKELISECLEQKKTFGIVRAEEEGLADVGCTAEIVAVTKTYPDGRMDIVTEGRERFEVLEVDEQRSYLRGDVVYFQDDAENPSSQQIEHAIELHREILTMVDDHTKANDQLKQIAGNKGVTLPTDLDSKDQALKDRLSKLDGEKFDQAYMKNMVRDHTKDVSEFRKESTSGKDSDLKSFASQTLPTLEDHLKEAKNIAPKQDKQAMKEKPAAGQTSQQ